MVKSIGLSWITVQDLEKTKKLFIDCFGFEVFEENKEYGWCEMILNSDSLNKSKEYVKWFGFTVYEKGVESATQHKHIIGLYESKENKIEINSMNLKNNQIINFPGQNAVITLVVKNIKKYLKIINNYGLLCSDITELPFKFKMFSFFDFDNNKIQLYEMLYENKS